MRAPYLLSAALILGACAHVPGTPTMEADASEIGIEGLALINELSVAYEPYDVWKYRQSENVGADNAARSDEICKRLQPSYQERQKYNYKKYNSENKKTEEIFHCLRFREPAGDSVSRYIQAGFALSDLYCDTFFRRIARRASERRFVRNGFNDAGTAVSLILGLVAAGSKVTGGAGAGFGLIDSTFRNYDDSFLVTSDLPRLQGLVQAAQLGYRDKVSLAGISDYPGANTSIIRYANYCSFVGMKALLNETIEDKITASQRRDNLTGYAVDFATAAGKASRTVAETNLANKKAEIAAKDALTKLAKPTEPTDGTESALAAAGSDGNTTEGAELPPAAPPQ